MKDPDQLYFDLVKRYGEQSKCSSRQVGAILVDSMGHVFGQGFNSAPHGSKTAECPRCEKKQYASGTAMDLAICCHAESNCLGNAARAGRSTDGATIYCTTYPCAECAKLIVAAGIKTVVFDKPYNSPLTASIFQNADIFVRRFTCST